MIKKLTKLNSFGGPTYIIDFETIFRIIIEDDNNGNIIAKSYRRGILKDKLLYSTSFIDDWSFAIPSMIRNLESYSLKNEKQTFKKHYWDAAIEKCLMSAPKSIDKWTKWFLTQKEILPKSGNIFAGKIVYEYDGTGKEMGYVQYKTSGDIFGRMENIYHPITGMLREKKWYRKVGSKEYLSRTYHYYYNSKDLLIRETWSDSEGKIDYEINKEYDQHQNCIESKAVDNGDFSYKLVHEYFENGKIAKTYSFNEDETLKSTTMYQLDPNGEYAFKYCDNRLAVKYETDYYSSGIKKKRSSISYAADGRVTSKSESEYDNHGNRILLKEFDENQKLSGLWIMLFNPNGLEIESRKYKPEN